MLSVFKRVETCKYKHYAHCILVYEKGPFLCVTTYAGDNFTLVRNSERQEEASRRISLLFNNSLEKELSQTCIHILQQTYLHIHR